MLFDCGRCDNCSRRLLCFRLQHAHRRHRASAIAGLVAGQSDEATLPVCDASVNVTFTTKFKPLFDQCSNVTGGIKKMLASPLYCKTPACISSMEIAHSVLSTCTPVADMYFTPGRHCTPECVNKSTQVRLMRSQCVLTQPGALGLCYQCKNYVLEMRHSGRSARSRTRSRRCVTTKKSKTPPPSALRQRRRHFCPQATATAQRTS